MTVENIRNIVILGAGTMGPGIAATFARCGYATTLSDVDAKQIAKAAASVDFVFDTLRAGGFATDADIEEARARLTLAVDASDAIAAADFVLENAPERLELKRSIFASLSGKTRDDAILASDTSGIPISALQEGLPSPGRVVGMHWSNPPHLIPVIEIVKGAHTSTATMDVTKAIVESLRMLPAIVDRDVPGFVENRILYAIMREALHLLDERVASAEAIDTIVRWGIGYKLGVVGPLRLLDMAGLDIYTSVASYLNKDLCNGSGISATVTARVSDGKLGIKTQAGLFDYTREEVERLARQRGRLFVASKKALTG
ncbi:MAG TPA: 3-hydroxyacyl-CoA dehydrogenase NAD-binding domain-containing protein [Casimicrobiaceae bacterium]